LFNSGFLYFNSSLFTFIHYLPLYITDENAFTGQLIITFLLFSTGTAKQQETQLLLLTKNKPSALLLSHAAKASLLQSR